MPSTPCFVPVNGYGHDWSLLIGGMELIDVYIPKLKFIKSLWFNYDVLCVHTINEKPAVMLSLET